MNRLKQAAATAVVLLAWSSTTTPARAQDASVRIPAQKVDAALRAMLPESIRTAGKLVSANNSSFPPYTIVIGSNQYTGASVDLATALGELLGLRIEHVSVNGLSGQLTGIKAGRFQFAIGPVPAAGHAVGHHRRQQRLDAAQEGNRQRRRQHLAGALERNMRELECRQGRRNGAKHRSDRRCRMRE